MSKSSAKSTLVYSTETGRMCPDCGQALAQCACHANSRAAVVGDGAVRVLRQSKGRGGKTVTLVKGLALDAAALAALAKQLRSACGAGASARASDQTAAAGILRWRKYWRLRR